MLGNTINGIMSPEPKLHTSSSNSVRGSLWWPSVTNHDQNNRTVKLFILIKGLSSKISKSFLNLEQLIFATLLCIKQLKYHFIITLFTLCVGALRIDWIWSVLEIPRYRIKRLSTFCLLLSIFYINIKVCLNHFNFQIISLPRLRTFFF